MAHTNLGRMNAKQNVQSLHFGDPTTKKRKEQIDHLFTFTDFDGVDAMNNLVERQLRPAVVIGGGSRETEITAVIFIDNGLEPFQVGIWTLPNSIALRHEHKVNGRSRL